MIASYWYKDLTGLQESELFLTCSSPISRLSAVLCIIFALGCPLLDLNMASNEEISAVEYCFLLTLELLLSLFPALLVEPVSFRPETEKRKVK